MNWRFSLGILGSLGTLAAQSFATPLTPDELNALQRRISCQDACEHGRVALLAQCVEDCPAGATGWDKNGDGVVTLEDERLAWREYYDEGTGDYVCYESNIVRHIEECEACTASHSDEDCSDAEDGDGIPAWVERAIGTSPQTANVPCDGSEDCIDLTEVNPILRTLGQECLYYPQANRSLCAPRACAANGSCTAFHLELVEKNDAEVIVRVIYDFLPVDPTLLDLKITFSGTALALTDARALDAATNAGKTVEVRQPSTGTARLVLVGADSSLPLQAGPIAELVFRRTSTAANASITFSKDDNAQMMAVAPDPGAARGALTVDELWGNAVDASLGRQRLLLHYSFDDSAHPLVQNSAQSAAELCGLLASCSVLPEGDGDRTKLTTQLNALQRGVVDGSSFKSGVTGPALTMDGRSDHLELPITVNEPASNGALYSPADQSFSLATWLLHDSNATGAAEVIFSHANGSSESTQFGLVAIPSQLEGHFELAFFQGDIGSTGVDLRSVASALPDRKWTHVALNLDASASTASVFVDGKPAMTGIALNAGSTASCPSLNPSGTRGLGIKKIGQSVDFAGKTPQVLSFAVSRNNLYSIEQMDQNGARLHSLIRLPDASALDPDYSPIVDKMVYASTAAGSTEIWIADRDGSNPIQITQEFGNTEQGVFARRPKWAPDGSGILFESNAFDIDANDNAWAHAYQVYFIAFDAKNAKVVIPQANSGDPPLTQLDYSAAVKNATIGYYRASVGYDNHSNVQWLRGGYSVGSRRFLGDFLVTTSDKNFDNNVVTRYSVEVDSASAPRVVANSTVSTSTPLAPFGGVPEDRATVLLAAKRIAPAAQPTLERRLLSEQHASYEPASDFELEVTAGGVASCPNGVPPFTATVYYTPTPNPDQYCWDIDGDFKGNADTEDANGDGAFNSDDCAAYEVRSLLLNISSTGTSIGYKDQKIQAEAGAWLGPNGKVLSVRPTFSAARNDVSINVSSPINSTSIPAGTPLASIALCGDTNGLSLQTRRVSQKLFVQSVVNEGLAYPEPFVLEDGVSEVLAAAFSPSTEQLTLSVIRNARPELIRTNLAGTAGSVTLSSEPARVEGLSWSEQDSFFPCNWLGAIRNPSNGSYAYPFKGAVDELKYFNYIRSVDAIKSEATRGAEWLDKSRLDGNRVTTQLPCESNAECPTYHLCLPSSDGAANVCKIKPCTPGVADTCAEGQGQCRPVPASLANAGTNACVVECTSDSQCFEKECLNGPCRFCADNVCKECRPKIDRLGNNITLRTTEGCPDQNSFSCDEGSCVSQCYSYENGQSRYLCDRATQYCRQGRCAMLDWSWSDFGLATLTGLASTKFDVPTVPTTVAQPNIYPIEIEAYGVSDYHHPAELLVEGKLNGVFDGKWFDIGRVQVRNIDLTQAQKNHYSLMAPVPITSIRVRLISPPYGNFNNAATGMLGRDKDFWLAQHPGDVEGAYRRHYGSRATLGYAAALTEQEVQRAANRRDPANYAPVLVNNQEHLHAGQPAVVVTSILVNGDSISTPSDQICSYEGLSGPVDAAGVFRLILYGDPANEQSNQKSAFYDAAMLLKPGLLLRNESPFVLNCNYANPNSGEIAAIVSAVNYSVPIQSSLRNPAMVENANGCTVQVSTVGGNSVGRPCYEWTGAGVTADFLSTSSETMYRTLEIEGLRSFGWDANP